MRTIWTYAITNQNKEQWSNSILFCSTLGWAQSLNCHRKVCNALSFYKSKTILIPSKLFWTWSKFKTYFGPFWNLCYHLTEVLVGKVRGCWLHRLRIGVRSFEDLLIVINHNLLWKWKQPRIRTCANSGLIRYDALQCQTTRTLISH